MGLETNYPELATLAQFFDEVEEIEWKPYTTPFSSDFDVVYIYGFSPYIDSLLEWLNQDERREIVFIEDRMAALSRIEDSILDHPQIQLRYYLGDVDLEEFISEVIRGFPFEKIGVICLHDNLERFKDLEKLLYRKATIESALHMEMIYSHKLTKNLIQNFHRLPNAFHVGLWKDHFKDVPAIVCGAGPSLKTVESELKSLENKALILAGGSTITALSGMNIRPHLLYAIDPNPEEFTRLAFHTAYDVPLIFGCRLEPNVFFSHAGPIGYLSTGTGGEIEKWMEEKLGIEDYHVLKGLGEEALSITTIAFMTAIYFGCNPIILAGVDLAYDAGKRYAKGVITDLQCVLEEKPKKSGEAIWREEELTTITKWIMERDVLDAVAKDHPEITFLKASLKGLEFNNIVHDPCWNTNLVLSRDIRSEIFNQVMATPISVNAEDVDFNLNLYFESMQKCKTIIFEIIQELMSLYPNIIGRESTQRSTILEMDLEEELAFQISLKQAVYALTFQVKRNHRPSNLPRNLYLIKLEVYRQLQSIIEQYLFIF